jgi:hypothetical protein
MAFLVDFVAGQTEPLTASGIRERLARPLKIPQGFLPKAEPGGRASEPPPPPPDPARTHREALLREQAALQSAYETFMRLHPSQLEVRSLKESGPPAPVRPAARASENGPQESAAVAAPSIVAVPRRTLEGLDPGVRRVIESELPDSSASLVNMVDIVKRRWLDVSSKVEPYKLPVPARTYRVGIHLFAVQEPVTLADMSGPMPTTAPDMSGPMPTTAPDFSYAITRPVGVGNLQVVRQELIGYEAAEISHIENVMPGELMRRVTQREETSELIVTEETETTQSEERDVQSTQRNELASEAQKEASQQTVATQEQTTTTTYGRLVENSKTNYARSVTDRAVNKLTQMVKQQRIRREKKVFSDRAVHQLDNKDGTEGIRGIYQWVDKKYKTRILNYGKRLLYDVVIPEPASFLIASLKSTAQPENFRLVRPTEPWWLYPSHLNAGNYMYWAALYGVTGSISPPPEDFVVTVAHTDTQNVDKKVQAYGQSFDAQVYQAFTIQIPENYKAVSGYIQQTNYHYTGAPSRYLEVFVGDRYYFRFNTNDQLNQFFAMNGESGTLPVTVNSAPQALQFNYAIGINCQRMDKALEQWQLKTHAAIMSGYQRQRAEYLDQLARYQTAVRTQMAMASTFAHDSSMERQELKKAFIHLLMSEHFGKVYIPTPNPQQIPPDPVYVKKWGAVVAFFERAFEWENLMYVYYPYFWGRPARWGELILLQDTDPEFEAFLKAGAARVLVPARPGFEAALAHYHETGDVWMGEEIPDMFSNMYTSIIAEIKARNAAPDEEVCVAEWDVRLPTTLVMLKEDDTLPTWKPAKDCNPPPEL